MGGLADQKTPDGFGAIVINNSDDTYHYQRFLNDSLGASDFPRRYNGDIFLTAGQVARVALAWDAWSTGGSGTDVLGADLDLEIALIGFQGLMLPRCPKSATHF